MSAIVTIIHIIVCLFLIGVVLLQQGKGADMGAVFGGSSSTIFGSSGAGNFLSRLTTAAAIIFMLTSLTLTYTSARRVSSTVFDAAPLPEPPPLEVPVNPGAQAPAGEAPAAEAPQAEAPRAEAPAPAVAPAEQPPAEPQAAAPEAAPAAPAAPDVPAAN